MTDNRDTDALDYNVYEGSAAYRNVIVQGRLIVVPRVGPRSHAGGGKRKKQHGHGQRAALRLHNYLSTCVPCKQVVWLTYEATMGPRRVAGNFRSLLKKLENDLQIPIGAFAKMEVQQRLAPELAVLIWPELNATIKEEHIEKLWHKTSKYAGRVKVEPVRDWNRLTSYVSKTIEIREAGIHIGRNYSPIQPPALSSFIISAHNPVYDPQSEQDAVALKFNGVLKEWQEYSGHYHWRYKKRLIPVYSRATFAMPVDDVDRWRDKKNRKRHTHFLGKNCSVTLRGEDAMEEYASLGFNPLR